MREYAVGDEPVPGYQIIRPLGAGGYGTVWVAKSPGDVEIALKIINLQGQGLKEFRAIGIVKRLRHPNLIPIYAFWLKDEFGNFLDSSAQDSINLRGKHSELIIAMGLGDKSLAQRLEECKSAFATKHGLPDTEGSLIARLQELGGADLAGLPNEELLEYMFGSARAIDYLNQPTHSLGTGPPSAIQHCDIKPGNLLIVSNDVQVCDYGLARVTGDARKTQAAGTPAYMAPELIAGKPSSGTDQYSLAITYYELRTGKLPFDESLAFHAHITGQLDFGLVTPTEQDILRRATHTRPDQRYPHTIEVVRALREAITPTRSPTPQSTPVIAPAAPAPASSPSGVYRSGSGSGPAASATPTIVTKPTVLDDLIRAGIELVPGHKLEQLLGRGGYGEVWAATMPGKTRCALKIVRNLDAVQGKQEFKSLDMIRDLDHDRLIRLQAYWLLAYDGSVIPDDQIGQPGSPKASALVIATDLAQQNLLQRWQECYDQGQAGIPKEELVPYLHQSAEAIDYLNFLEPAIVHRDIKPENILLTKNRQVKVSDFGLAKLVEGTSAAINTASVGMTLAYAAPELFRNKVTRWTDQYSLALTYYRLRIGRLPFEDGMGPIQMMQAHASGTLDFSGIGDGEQTVLRRACSVESEARFGSCVEFVEALATAVGISRPSVPATAQHSHPVSSPAVGAGSTAGARWPTETARQPAASQGAMTARFPGAGGPADSGANVRETMRFDEAKAPAGSSPGWPQAPTQPPRPHLEQSSNEFHLPDKRRGLPPGLMETTNSIPSMSDLDTAPDGSREDWRATKTAPRPSGGKKIALAVAAGVVLIAGGAAYYLTGVGRNTTTNTGKVGPGTDDGVADLRSKTKQAVADAIGKNDFPTATKEVRTTAAKTGADWAAEQDAVILAAWRQYAEGQPSGKEKRDEFKRLLESYPADKVAKDRVAVIGFAEENKHLTDQFTEAMAKLREGAFADSRSKLADVSAELDRISKESPEGAASIAAVREQLNVVTAALTDLDRRAAEPATEALVGEIANVVSKTKPAGAPEYQLAIREAYRRALGDKVEQLVPALGATTRWLDLLAACRTAAPVAGSSPAQPANPWATACRAECAAELLGRGQPAGPAGEEVTLTTPDKAAPPLAAYFQYVVAARQAATSPGSNAAAQALAALAPNSADPPTTYLNDYRRGRVLAGLRAAVAKVQGANSLVRFSGSTAADAVRWLGAATRLADRDAKLPAADRLRLAFDLALACLAVQPPDVDKARSLTETLVPEAAQKVWQPSVQEKVALWTAFAGSRDATPAGRLAAVKAYAMVFEILRDDLAGVGAAYLQNTVIRPLIDDGGKQLLGDRPDRDTTVAAAKLYYMAARIVRRYADAWSEIKDLAERDRLQLIVRLFERAAELDKKPEFLAWVGIAKGELPGGDAGMALPADVGGSAPAVALLRGIVLIGQADKLKDVTQRVNLRRQADRQFRDGLIQCGSKREYQDEKVLLYQRAADNCIKLANGVGKARSAEMRKYLDASKDDADKLLELDPNRLEVYDTRGCAVEDMAWLRADDDRFGPNGIYAKAIDDFTKAIGGYGGRAAPWMHRGRCRFKWAEDLTRQPAATGLDDGLLTAAANDLNHVLEMTTDTAESLEANYWLGKVALIRQSAPGVDPAALYRQAAESLRRTAELARSLHLTEWDETALKEWSAAAYLEADRLAPARNQPAQDALEEALARADAVKEFSPPWTAFTTMQLRTDVQKKLEPTKDRIPEAIAASVAGLDPNCRAQDRMLQFLIRMLLVDYRTSILNANARHKNGDLALIDAKAAMDLVTAANLPEADKARATGAEGMAYLVIQEKTSNPADQQKAREAFLEAVRIAPDHEASWKWKTYLGIFRVNKKEATAKTRAEDATRLAEGYRLFREAEATNPRRTEEEVSYDRYLIRPQREAAEKPGYPLWVELMAADTEKNNPDRPTWILAAAEKLALSKDDAPKAKKYLADGRKAVADLPEGQREAHRRQIERIQALLKAAG
jgi:serine/threonine protein kinase